jgi:hypothetical protein
MNPWFGNMPYTATDYGVDFVKEFCRGAKELETDADTLRLASDSVTVDGFFLEFGVCTGTSINFLGALNPKKTIYGFDSFEGIPEDWDIGFKTFPSNSFSLF